MCGDYGRLCQSKRLLSDFLAVSNDFVIACGRFFIFYYIPQYTENTGFFSNSFAYGLHGWGILSVIPLGFQENTSTYDTAFQ